MEQQYCSFMERWEMGTELDADEQLSVWTMLVAGLGWAGLAGLSPAQEIVVIIPIVCCSSAPWTPE